MPEQKREQKSIWVPKQWLEWIRTYYKENEVELKKLGINSFEDLVWRLAELGKSELNDLIELLKARKKS